MNREPAPKTETSFTEGEAAARLPKGFRAGGVACDVRAKGETKRLDLAAFLSDRDCAAAGLFTVNDVKAAPILLCQETLASATNFRGIVANSGNANACTGHQGIADTREMQELSAMSLGIEAGSCFVASTGRIGRRLPMANVREGIAALPAALGDDRSSILAAAEALLTSDTRVKLASATIELPDTGEVIRITGVAKGAGMIEPNMATMLAFVFTDAQVEQGGLYPFLKYATDISFNRISIDGNMSTNDSVLLLANGASDVSINRQQGLKRAFGEALQQVCTALAKMIVADGERISHVVELRIRGARSEGDATKVARAIANSLLVKSSWYGNDPNWGRLADAAGYAGAGLRFEKLSIYYDDTPVVLQGEPQEDNSEAWKAIVSQHAFSVTLDLGLGGAETMFWTTDLTEGYVAFNRSE